MSSLSFPDVNVWLALLSADHVHRKAAHYWWDTDESDTIAFSRFTQMGILRLLTTAEVMNNTPLTMDQAWRAYDRLFSDDRVALLPEPGSIEPEFRKLSSSKFASRKVWADAYLIAFATQANGTLVTFDRALEKRIENCLVLG